MEIERKFLYERLPEAAGEPRRIEQGYLAITEDGTEVRVRRWEYGQVLTVKHGSGEVRIEVELPIDDEQFDELWPLTEGARIEKERWIASLGELEAELDVFEGELEGLRIAEIEFPDEDAARAFDPPGWLGAEVTEDKRYSNERLATDGPPG
jgi:CYTH domain-containing protein